MERIGELLSRLQSPDFFEREEAVKELGRYREDEAVAGLVLAIEDADLGIRELAADFLTEIKGETASELLCRFLAHLILVRATSRQRSWCASAARRFPR